MLTLRYRTEFEDVLLIKSKLSELTLAFKDDPTPETIGVVLIDGPDEFAGLQQIMDHLADIYSELHQWYYCGC